MAEDRNSTPCYWSNLNDASDNSRGTNSEGVNNSVCNNNNNLEGANYERRIECSLCENRKFIDLTKNESVASYLKRIFPDRDLSHLTRDVNVAKIVEQDDSEFIRFIKDDVRDGIPGETGGSSVDGVIEGQREGCGCGSVKMLGEDEGDKNGRPTGDSDWVSGADGIFEKERKEETVYETGNEKKPEMTRIGKCDDTGNYDINVGGQNRLTIGATSSSRGARTECSTPVTTCYIKSNKENIFNNQANSGVPKECGCAFERKVPVALRDSNSSVTNRRQAAPSGKEITSKFKDAVLLDDTASSVSLIESFNISDEETIDSSCLVDELEVSFNEDAPCNNYVYDWLTNAANLTDLPSINDMVVENKQRMIGFDSGSKTSPRKRSLAKSLSADYWFDDYATPLFDQNLLEQSQFGLAKKNALYGNNNNSDQSNSAGYICDRGARSGKDMLFSHTQLKRSNSSMKNDKIYIKKDHIKSKNKRNVNKNLSQSIGEIKNLLTNDMKDTAKFKIVNLNNYFKSDQPDRKKECEENDEIYEEKVSTTVKSELKWYPLLDEKVPETVPHKVLSVTETSGDCESTENPTSTSSKWYKFPASGCGESCHDAYDWESQHPVPYDGYDSQEDYVKTETVIYGITDKHSMDYWIEKELQLNKIGPGISTGASGSQTMYRQEALGSAVPEPERTGAFAENKVCEDVVVEGRKGNDVKLVDGSGERRNLTIDRSYVTSESENRADEMELNVAGCNENFNNSVVNSAVSTNGSSRSASLSFTDYDMDEDYCGRKSSVDEMSRQRGDSDVGSETGSDSVQPLYKSTLLNVNLRLSDKSTIIYTTKPLSPTEFEAKNDSHYEQYSTEPSTQTCDEEVTEKNNEPAENYHTQSTENYRRDEKTYGTNLQSVEDHEQQKPCDMLEEVETKIPTPAVRQNVPSNQETRTISEDDMTKSPSCSESENEEVVEDGEVVYRSNDETHTSDVRREIPKYRDNIITGTEPGDIGDRLVLFEDYEHSHKTSKEEVSPGKINSPFISGGLQSSANAQAKDDIKFTDMANFRGKFEGGHMDHHHEAKAPRTITPPRDHEKTEFCNEDLERDPNIVRSDEMVNEDEYMPKAGSSQMIVQRFKQASTQERDYRPVRSVKDEIHSTAKVEYENQPERFEQWQNKTEGGIYENEPNYRPDVMREQDPKNYEAELPEVGYTRNVLQHFKTIQSDDRHQGKSIRRELTPPMSDQVEFSNEPSRGIELYEGKPEAGIFESQPQIREDVVHADEGEEIVLPEQGYARNVAKMFRQMSEAGGSQTPKSQKEFTPPRDESPMVENMPAVQAAVRESDEVDAAMPSQGSTRDLARRFQQMQHEDAPRSADHRIDTGASSNAGVYENHPEVNQSVVHADDQLEEQLPEQGLARNLVAQFRQMESGGHQRQSQGLKSKEFTPPREEPRIVELRQRASSGGVQPDDIPEQYHLQAEHGGVFESQPDQRSDVMREADTDWDDGLPTPDTTKNLVARFKNIQQNAHEDSQTPKPINRKESPPSVRFQMAQTAHPLPTATSTPSYKVATPSNTVATSSNQQDRPARFHVIQLEKCDACNKTVYITERFEFNKCVYHKTCFKCDHCRRTLTPATYAVNEHQLYCMTHYKQMFKTKGNYDEGFGRTQYKKRWQSEPNLSTSSDEEITTSSYHR